MRDKPGIVCTIMGVYIKSGAFGDKTLGDGHSIQTTLF